uniref:Uncharacterized protein n=1 Tax=Sus scrofa TaxID=9823 RepID=A0A8D0Z2I4_PIG
GVPTLTQSIFDFLFNRNSTCEFTAATGSLFYRRKLRSGAD